MLYVRGLESDFEKWNITGLDYASAVEAWKGLENYTGDGDLPPWHGSSGPIITTPPSYVDEVRRVELIAASSRSRTRAVWVLTSSLGLAGRRVWSMESLVAGCLLDKMDARQLPNPASRHPLPVARV